MAYHILSQLFTTSTFTNSYCINMSEGEGLFANLGMDCPKFLFYVTNFLACQFFFHCSGYGCQCISKTQSAITDNSKKVFHHCRKERGEFGHGRTGTRHFFPYTARPIRLQMASSLSVLKPAAVCEKDRSSQHDRLSH